MVLKRGAVGFFLLLTFLLFLHGPGLAQLNNVSVTGVSLDTGAVTLEVGDSINVNATVHPDDASDKNVWWHSSSDEVVEVVGSGLSVELAARSKGEAVVTVITVDGEHRASCRVEVIVPVRTVGIKQESVTIAPNDTLELEAQVIPREANEQGIIWESSNPGVASVTEEGLVRAKNKGDTRIIARSVEDQRINTYITITVSDQVAPVDTDETPVVEAPVEDEPVAEGWPLLYYILGGVAVLVLIAVGLFLVLNRGQKGQKAQVPPDEKSKEAKDKPVLVGLKGAYAGQRIEFSSGKVTIGRDSSLARVVYPADSSMISRQHCTVYYDQEQQQFTLVDTSSNGTFLENGEKLGQNNKHNLQPGDTFSLTESEETFTVELE